MNNYKFRTNLVGQLVLQYRAQYRDHWGDPQYRWRDADIGDLQEYYNYLARLQDPRQSIREEFEAQCG